MTKSILSVSTLALFFSAQTSYGFGAKKMQISELKGVTETQVALGEGKAQVMVRGKAAELLFKVMREQQQKHEERTNTEALRWIGKKNASEWIVQGRQITCSKVTRNKFADYACAFSMDEKGALAAVNDAFDPQSFNLAHTATGSKVFQKKANRSLASVTPPATYSKGSAYLVYDAPGHQRLSEDTMIVMKGPSAKNLLGLLSDKRSGTRELHFGGATGRRGIDLACVDAKAKEPARCALVISFKDGSVTHTGNPLFR